MDWAIGPCFFLIWKGAVDQVFSVEAPTRKLSLLVLGHCLMRLASVSTLFMVQVSNDSINIAFTSRITSSLASYAPALESNMYIYIYIYRWLLLPEPDRYSQYLSVNMCLLVAVRYLTRTVTEPLGIEYHVHMALK